MKHNLNRMNGIGQARKALWARKILVLILAMMALAGVAAAKDIALVSNKSNSLPEMTIAELLKVCKGQMNRWPDGKPVTLVMREPGSADMKIVEEKVYAATAEAVEEIVAAANHSRKDRPAIIIAKTDQDVIRKVEATPGAVGLVDVYSITGAVEVIRIGGKLPLEAGYPLHGN